MKPSRKRLLRDYQKFLYNPISMVGLGLIVVSLAMLFALMIISWLSEGTTPYLGIIAFVILPPILFLGLILVPLGLRRQRRRLHEIGALAKPYFRIDFNIPRHRWLFQIVMVSTLFLLAIVSIVSYQAFHYTESIEFCSTCHSVMKPETTTHKLSPHARVTCVECHVGSGADWYVRSKLSGLYQVYSTIFEKYSRPIETPIENLRPARDTCEECHWPKYFIDDTVVTYHYFLQNEENTHGQVSLLMKIGGHREYGEPYGIHWHVTNRVTFIARDEKKQDIPWIEVVREDGEAELFQSADDPLTAEEADTLPRHEMDCIDCHNRPSHIFKPPSEILSTLMVSGRVDTDLPEIRYFASSVMTAEYESSEEAVEEIENSLVEEYGELAEREGMEQELARTIEAIQNAYLTNFFPAMKARWDVHPSNIGHKWSKGCYRCHDDNHVSDRGATISRRCTTCHLIVSQGTEMERTYDPRGLEFEHPEDIDEMWREVNCSECHGGE